jgi:hypothetical protein
MARKTISLRPLIVRLLIAAAIAGMLSLCSLAIERTKGFFKLSDAAGTHKIIGTRPPRLSPLPVRSKSIPRQPYCEQTNQLFKSGTEGSAPYRAAISAGSGSIRAWQALHNTSNRTPASVGRVWSPGVKPHHYSPRRLTSSDASWRAP